MTVQNRRFPLYVSITTLVVSIVITLTAAFLWISYRESKTAAVLMADRLFSENNQKVMERYERALESVMVLAGAAARMPAMAVEPTTDGIFSPGTDLMFEALAYYDYLFSTYTGHPDGSFVQITAVRGQPDLLKRFGAPAGTFFIVRTISSSSDSRRGGARSLRFLDRNRNFIGTGPDADPDYDPRKKPWYIRAQTEGSAFYTEPYVLNSSGIAGITCAEKLVAGDGVFGADITLERFSISLERQKVSENGRLVLFDRRGRIIAHSRENPIVSADDETLRFVKGEESGDPLARAVVAAYRADPKGILNHTVDIRIGASYYLVRLTGLKAKLKFNPVLASIAPVSDFTGHIRRMQEHTFLLSGLLLVLVLPLALVMSRKISASLMRLERESVKIRQFDFSESEPFDSRIKEIHANIQAFVLMKTTIRDRTDALIATQNKLETLVQSGIALTAEDDMDRLLRKIFESARKLSSADGGTLYLRDKADNLRFEIMQNVGGEIIKADAAETGDAFAPISLAAEPADETAPGGVERQAALTGKTVVVNRADGDSGVDASRTCRLDKAAGIVCSNYLTVPLRTREGKTIGVLQVFNARDEKTRETTDFNTEMVGFVEALAAQAAVALDNKRLLDEQRALFDAFVQLLAGAIDAKSPYTGGHCARVPEVAAMLARAAHEANSGPFAGFKMETRDQWREFNVAAWLHDCGKVTTPEYVVDKATKLETIYNRLHEIRMRFEVLLRDAEIDACRKRLDGTADERTAAAELEQARMAIEADFAFVAECNIGGEFMGDEKIERLNEIAARTWVRYLDDRLGISQDEAALKSQARAQAPPVVEHLLADKPEHIVPRTGPDPFGGNPHGFKMKVPEHLYNLGELYNLGIRKGTLSPEDRFKINEHIVQTIIMLKKLPFPRYLEKVAEYAGSHHETMTGTGYPRGLTKEQMSVPARIMAIADIFEALTAADRPYKKPKTLNEALRIMSFMRNDRHIDAELFDLFLESGVYRTYAERFLDPGQNDAVDIRQYLSTRGDG